MANRYSRLDNQSPVQSQLEADFIDVGRSAHDCSHIVSGTTMYGILAPVLCMEVVPNEDIDLSATALLEFRNPTTRQLFNSSRVFFHAYYNRLTDLWEGARNWLDNGRRGKVQLNRPNLIWRVQRESTSEYALANTPMSLLNFFGLPAEVYCGSNGLFKPLRWFTASAYVTSFLSSNYITGSVPLSKATDYFPADCCMAYQRNWRDFYSNKNLLQNNKYWFPDNEDHFILSYSCESAVCIRYEDEGFNSLNDDDLISQARIKNIIGFDSVAPLPDVTREPNNPSSSPSENLIYSRSPNLAGIKFRQFRGDRFTTGSPFPDLIRGDIPLLNLDAYAKITVPGYDFSSSVSGHVEPSGSGVQADFMIGDSTSSLRDHSTGNDYALGFNTSLTMSDIYTLETLTAFRRRMGMTNGDYNEMIKSQYGVDPHVHDRRGTYIGGFYQDFAFSSVTQTVGTESAPLGQKGGQGVSSGAGSFGHFHTPDFGWIQVYMSISVDSMYTQGKPRQFSKRSNLEMYFPIFNNLPAQAIRNDELFISGDSSVDSQPFAYEDRYAEFKSIPNRVTGFMALPHTVAKFDSSRIMARRFSSVPALNSLFVSMVPENVDMEVFSVYDEPPFDFSIGFNIRRVFPGPYTAIEGSLSAPILNKA